MRYTIRSIHSIVAVLALAAGPAHAAAQQLTHTVEPRVAVAAEPAAAAVDALFAPWDRSGSPGAAMAVIRDGQPVHSRGYGVANLEYGIPIEPSSVFHIASISKHFTTFAIGLLAQEGRLSLDDDIRRYLPEVPDFGTPITIRHLIHHTSGLRDQWELLAMAGWRLDDVITREHILKMVAHQRELNFEPGAEYLYSNTGYTLMAEIVARVSGTSFPRFADERIFQPLGMTSTHFHDDHQRVVRNRAYSYAPAPGGWRAMPLNYANVGATSLFTTVEDLAKWDRNFYTGEVGGAALLEAMHTRGVLNHGDTIPYAHALIHGEYRGLATVSHGGADAGYRTAFLRFPEQRLSVVVFSNLSTFNPMRLAQQVAELYLADRMEPEPPTRTQPTASGRAPRIPAAELAALAGVYVNPATDQLRHIELRDGRLVIAGGGPDYELRPQARNRFTVLEAPAQVELRFEPENGRGSPVRIRETIDSGAPVLYHPVVVPTEAELRAFAGTYYSEELGTAYTLVLQADGLVAQHRRHPDVSLLPTLRDRFAGDAWWFRRLHFTRDAAGTVDGFRLSGGRVRELRFVRIDG
jgi:CubicO group peptidase (beta-lactamase class C family)